MKIAIPHSKKDLVIECCNSALASRRMEPELIDVVVRIQDIFMVDSDSPFRTAIVYVVEEEDFDLVLRYSDIPYNTVGDMDVVDEELKNKVHEEDCRSF